MPPPLNPQGSRAGLITAVVVLSILFVTSAIFAFYYSAEANKKDGQLKQVNDKKNQYANNEAEGDPMVAALVEARGDKSAIQVAVDRLGKLSTYITGSANPPQSAEQTATASIEKAVQLKDAGVAPLTASSSLSEVVDKLAERVSSLDKESKEKTAALDTASAALKAESEQRTKMETELNGKFDEQGKQLADALAQLATKREESEKSVQSIQGEVDRAVKTAQAQASQFQTQLTAANGTIAQLKAEIDILKTKVPRLENTSNAVLRQSDGRIVRVPGNDNVFIDLGKGDGISRGMTFEVYDRYSGVPGISNEEEVNPTDEAALPKGKASIEVIRVDPRQSECRIIRSSVAQPVVEGDLIANLVYDRNTKYNVLVFGNFDLDQDQTPTPGDAAVIKQRVTEWGGRLQDQVNVDTDFVVLGFEPEVPLQEENESATDIERRRKAEEDITAYNDVISKARGLNIPILNQNRFLYYTGYFEQAKR